MQVQGISPRVTAGRWRRVPLLPFREPAVCMSACPSRKSNKKFASAPVLAEDFTRHS